MIRKLWSVCLAAVLLTIMGSPLAAQQQVDQEQLYRLVNKIRKRLLTLNNYGVFDYITFGLKGGTSGVIVVLQGYASRPPTGLGWLIKPFIQNMPRESLLNTLQATRLAVKR